MGLLKKYGSRSLPLVFWMFLSLIPAGSVHAQVRYVFSSDGSEVTDTNTGLVWQRCSAGQVWNSSSAGCAGTASTYTHQAALSQAKAQGGWRLPNVKELSSLVNRGTYYPAIDRTVFPGTPPSGWYWSSSPNANGGPTAWVVNFLDGSVVPTGREAASGLIRLVR